VELYLYFPYMSTLNVLSGAEIKNEWSYTSISLYVYTKRVIYCRG